MLGAQSLPRLQCASQIRDLQLQEGCCQWRRGAPGMGEDTARLASAPDFPVDERTDRGFANWFRSLEQVRPGCCCCRQHQGIAFKAKPVLMAERLRRNQP